MRWKRPSASTMPRLKKPAIFVCLRNLRTVFRSVKSNLVTVTLQPYCLVTSARHFACSPLRTRPRLDRISFFTPRFARNLANSSPKPPRPPTIRYASVSGFLGANTGTSACIKSSISAVVTPDDASSSSVALLAVATLPGAPKLAPIGSELIGVGASVPSRVEGVTPVPPRDFCASPSSTQFCGRARSAASALEVPLGGVPAASSEDPSLLLLLLPAAAAVPGAFLL
mmetsp:Transcript_45036/g.127404  ORF Transcript_45036/g.127404 Transcript_45036/m.127404 type:complete len:227 (+) Transcript_45036:888-1568(+)